MKLTRRDLIRRLLSCSALVAPAPLMHDRQQEPRVVLAKMWLESDGVWRIQKLKGGRT